MKIKTGSDWIRFYPESEYDLFLCGFIAAKSDYWDRMHYSREKDQAMKADYLEISQLELLLMLREAK